MRRPFVLWIALVLSAAAGCRSRSDLVEAELRTKDRQLRETRAELLRAQTMNTALENTLRDQHCAQPILGPGPGSRIQVKDIQLGRGTGGLDEGLQIVLAPRDMDGSAIKAPGALRVTALGITPEGLKVPLSTWDVSALQLQRNWQSGGFFGTAGYSITLPWQKLPTTQQLRVIATFLPPEGGAFEAEKDVRVHLLESPRLHTSPTAPLLIESPISPVPHTDTPTLPPPEPLPVVPTPGTPPPAPIHSWQPVPAAAGLLPPRPILPIPQ